MQFIVYTARNRVNGKVYVGQTTQHLEKRKQDHLYAARSGAISPFYSAIRKYGECNFKFEVLWTASSYGHLDCLEELAIKQHKATDRRFGYNLSPHAKHSFRGGSYKPHKGPWHGNHVPVHVKRKISRTRKLRYKMNPNSHPMLGRKHTKEAKLKMSKASKQRAKTAKGRAHLSKVGLLGAKSRWGTK